MDSQKQHITLHIGSHRLELNVPREEEQTYRQAAQLLNERSLYYLRNIPEASAEQVWVYVALETATNWQREAVGRSLRPIEQKVQELNEQIEQVLHSSENADSESK